MKKLAHCIMCLSFVLCINTAQAQEKSESEIEKIWNAVKSKLPKFSGWIDVGYKYSDDENTFDVTNVRLNMDGYIIDKFGYDVQVDYGSSIQMRNVLMFYEFDPRFKLTVGQMKLPFSLENPLASPNLELFHNSMAVTNLVVYNDIVHAKSTSGRDIGVQISGKFFPRNNFDILRYEVGVFNGSGMNKSDENKHKDVVGRVHINPVKPLTLSASAYIGKYSIDESNLDSLGTKNRFAVGASYKDDKFMFRGEYLWGKTHATKSEGYYVAGSYEFVRNVSAVLKYDYWQRDKSIKDGWQKNYSAGVDYLYKNRFRARANYVYRTFKHDKDNGMFVLLLSYFF